MKKLKNSPKKINLLDILERIEKCSKEGNSNPLEKDVRNLVLEHKKVEEGNNNKMGGCC